MKLEPKEKLFLFCICTAIMVITSLPYFVNSIKTPQDRVYTGIHHLTPGDVSVYYSFIEQGRQNQLVSRNLYSSEAQTPTVFTPQWFLLGQLANLFNFPTVLIFQLARIGFGALFIYLIYKFIAGVINSPRVRMFSVGVLMFITGFGVFIPIKNLGWAIDHIAFPVDMWVPESSPFLMLYFNPLFLMALCLLLAALLFFEKSLEKHDLNYAWLVAGLVLLLAIIHPYDVFLFFGILAVWLAIKWAVDKSLLKQKFFIKSAFFGLWPGILAMGITRLIFQSQPALQGWLKQNNTPSPAVWWYLPAYLLPIIFAIFGLSKVIKIKTNRAQIILAWAVIVPILLYLPYFPYQRRMQEGWLIPLGVFAAFGLVRVINYFKTRITNPNIRMSLVSLGLTLGLMLTLMTSIYHLGKDLVFSWAYKEPVTISKNIIAGYEWFKKNSSLDAVILARPFDSNRLPGWAGRTVYYGHGDLTAASKTKAKLVNDFFGQKENFDYPGFLKEGRINYLLLRKADDEVIIYLKQKGILQEAVYQNAEVLIFKTKYN
ncbi:MAG: hypothetical protein WCT08_05170 [Patescibacteria group bacterium]|jgi:hypothetical protein